MSDLEQMVRDLEAGTRSLAENHANALRKLTAEVEKIGALVELLFDHAPPEVRDAGAAISQFHDENPD